MRSAFSGHIEEIPYILVDNFENDLDKNAYFLSHYHGDHVFGLADNQLRATLKRNNVFIYASKVTVAIIKEQCPRLSPHLKTLHLGTNTISMKRDGEEIFLKVITLPAGHSLGSVMFLFEYNNKKILYTGDFRISRNSVSKYAHFHKKGKPIDLDVMYVDTTFQNVPSFPKRSEVVRNAILHIKNWLNLSERHHVILLTCAGYGYEYVCNEIYNETKMKCYVDDSYWRIYSQFPKEIYGMTNDPSSRLHLRTKFGYKGQSNQLQLQVYFSAFKWGDKQNIEEEFLTFKENRIEVCFSTHCGRDELVYFINYFKPNKIVGFPDAYKQESYINILQEGFPYPERIPLEDNCRIMKKKRRRIVKESVKVGETVNKSILKEAFDW